MITETFKWCQEYKKALRQILAKIIILSCIVYFDLKGISYFI